MSDEKIVVNIDVDLEDLIPGFIENRQNDILKLGQAFADQDLETLRSIGHNLKGVGGGYGFHEMTTLGAAIEEGAKENNLENIDENIKNLSHYLSNVEINYQEE